MSVGYKAGNAEFRTVYGSRKLQDRTLGALVWIVVVCICLLMILPLFIMLSTALKTKQEMFVYPPTWIPTRIIWHNFVDAMKSRPFGHYFSNTALFSVFGTLGEVLVSSFVAFGFSRYRGKGRNVMFMILLSTLMIPYPVIMIPQFVLFKTLGWTDSYLPLLVPSFFGSAYIIFLLRQFFMTLPGDLLEAARLDGCGEFRAYWNIALPLCKSALASAAIFGFMFRWNEYLQPLIYLNTDTKFTVSIALASFRSMYSVVPWNLLMAASLVALLPPILVFFFAQKYFVQGIVVSGLK
ncbi:carbohydrate ABC transporter permease [Paenibacillus humicola]|uniref:carbohydrate ABC transporter permease n=1 Tax=Paenibacillus humicola TaxID=3110540 RepID=UPI00237B21D1|nr:carbohydrate ABC transporter permease [Paenibacillus humicola]